MLSDWTDENPSQPAEKLKTVGLLQFQYQTNRWLFFPRREYQGCQPPLPIGKCGLK
jgi:hypothetical protein